MTVFDTTIKEYLTEIDESPLLTWQQERELAERIIENDDPQARDILVRSNLRLVVSIAKRFATGKMSLGDLIEEGNLGLIRAVDSFDPEVGVRFSTYAAWWIKQTIKRALLTKTGVDAGRVTFVAADFEKDDWLAKLVEAGFDPAKPALFLWEGVTIYLDCQAVEATLRTIAGTAAGSMVAFDYFTTESLESAALYWRYARWATKAAGEPLKFGIDSTPPSRQRLAEFLQACGLSLGEQRTLGQETAGQRAWGGFATAVVK